MFTVVGRAAVLRKDSRNRPVDDAEALVCCSGFGEPNRSSDPTIGAGVNGLVRDGLSVSLADPLGLYMAGINAGAFQGPTGEDMSGAWRVDRGDAATQRILRATFAAPAGLTVDQVLAAGIPIAYGGQIADEVQMIVTALAKRIHASPPARKRCVTRCCENRDRPGVVTVVDRGVKCSTVDRDALAPATSAAPDSEPRAGAAQPGPGRAGGDPRPLAGGPDAPAPVTVPPKFPAPTAARAEEPILAVADIQGNVLPVNRRNGPEGDAGHDLLVGQGNGPNRERAADLRCAESGGAPARISTLVEWVVPTGGGYFFAPSISALRHFAEGDPG